MENITESKQAVIYYHVSTEDQAQHGVILEQQKKACLEYAERNNIEIIEKFHPIPNLNPMIMELKRWNSIITVILQEKG